MPSWRGAQLKHRDNFTFTYYLDIDFLWSVSNLNFFSLLLRDDFTSKPIMVGLTKWHSDTPETVDTFSAVQEFSYFYGSVITTFCHWTLS